MAKMYGTRPSDLLGVRDPYEAFCLDHACFVKLADYLADEQPDGGRRFRPGGYEMPAASVRASVPWSGPGPDPLGGTL